MYKNRKIPWTQEEVDLLVDLYKKELKYDDMLPWFPNRTKAALVLKIRKLKVKRPRYKTVNVFHQENLTDCWFAGFFLGDGSIDALNKGRFHLSKKHVHLLDFIAKHFGFPSSRVKLLKKSCRLNFCKGFILNLQETFSIHRNKSYGEVVFPEFLSLEQMKCFFIRSFV